MRLAVVLLAVVGLGLAQVPTMTQSAQQEEARCPAGSFLRAEVRGSTRCVCPHTHVCSGCAEGCQVDPSPLKARCVKTFSPDCTDCTCTPGPELQAAVQRGRMWDRRKEPFCPPPTPEAHKLAPSIAAQIAHLRAQNHTMVFTISNGHTGTTFLGMSSMWRRHFGKYLPHGFHVTHESELDKETLKRIPWEKDYCRRSRDYVEHFKVPQIESILEDLDAHTFFASGHQVILGLIPALADILGDRARFLRLRRNRFDTAYSFYKSKNGDSGPCSGRCIFCLCPLDPLARCPVDAQVWEDLNPYQRHLWSVDEIECQWQSFLRSRPGVHYMELNWDKRLTAEQMLEVAKFIDMDVSLQAPSLKETANGHLSAKVRSTKNYTWMEEMDRDYRQKVGHAADSDCNTYFCLPKLQ